MCSYVSGNFMEDGGGEKYPDNSPRGKFRPGHYTHTDPTWTWTLEKNVTWQEGAKTRNLAGGVPKNVTWQEGANKT